MRCARLSGRAAAAAGDAAAGPRSSAFRGQLSALLSLLLLVNQCLTRSLSWGGACCCSCCSYCAVLQVVDTLVGSVWESRNQGKLFKDLQIPVAEE